MELQPKTIYFNWWIWRVTNDPASGARISFKETSSFSTVQQELYSRMAAWTGQKGLGDGRLYGIKSRRCFADGSYIQEEKMLLGDFQLPCWSNTPGFRCHSTIFNPLSCKSLELHFSIQEISKFKTVDEKFLRPPSARFGWDLWLDFSSETQHFCRKHVCHLSSKNPFTTKSIWQIISCQSPADEKVGKGHVFFF